MNERLDRFTKLLKEIFELDKSDLDFGIYRVMNLRKAQIEQFLTERLPKMVQETLAPFAQGSKEEIRAKMKQIEESVAEMGMTVDALPNTAQKKQQYLQLQKQLAEGADLAALETDVYSALYSFFNRYYEDGDFISKRRYKEGVYAIPYEGEEVKLYWANQDQYYIKTSENFKDYTFVFDGINVHFRLVDATTEQNNNKESKDNKRAFMLFREDEEIYPGIKTFEYDPDTAEIVIRFVYDIPEDKKKKYTEENYARITEWLLSQRRAELNPLIAPIPTGKGRETTTLLEKHLKGYLGIGIKVKGRLDGTLSQDGELNPDSVARAVGKENKSEFGIPSVVEMRPPALCEGCGHRDMYITLTEVLKEEYPSHKVFSDIGCYTLGANAPFNAINSCVDMGASITMAKGAADGGLHPSVAVIGDSTFTHSGMTGLLDCVNENANVVIVISDNETTAMTGGQDSAGTGRIESICIGLGVDPAHIRVVVPLKKNHEEMRQIIREEIEYNGVSVIIPRRECIQTLARKKRSK